MIDTEDATSTSALTYDLLTSQKQSEVSQNATISQQGRLHCFDVYCFSQKKCLKDKIYTSMNEIKTDVLHLYDEYRFDGEDIILTHYDVGGNEVLLTSVPEIPGNGLPSILFIKFVHPGCGTCSGPFGIVENQLLYQCPKAECGMQYCDSCVRAIQGLSTEYPFVCIECKKNVEPQRKTLIEKHLIWKNMQKLYGIPSLTDLTTKSEFLTCQPILNDIEFRRIHLQSRLDNFEARRGQDDFNNSSDTQLTCDVRNLCTELQKLVDQLSETDERIEDRGIIVHLGLEMYREDMRDFDRVCETLANNVENISIGKQYHVIDISGDRTKYLKQKYYMDNLDKLKSDNSIKAIDDILKDISFRKKMLSPLLGMITSFLEKKPQQNAKLDDDLMQAKKQLQSMCKTEEHLIGLRTDLCSIKQYIDEYDTLLRDENFKDISGSKFIFLIEKLRVRTEELERSSYFPRTSDLMETWQRDHRTGKEFKPKVMDLFIALESDLKYLISGNRANSLIPYKIGVIGHGSIGKSALIMNLIGKEKFSRMISTQRSTFGHLPFDTYLYKHPDTDERIPITFIDLQGDTDVSDSEYVGNYKELMKIADCDLYIIAFKHPFSDRNSVWQRYIQKELKRECILVMTQSDLVFKEFYNESVNRRSGKNNINVNFHRDIALKKTEEHSLVTFNEERLPKEAVYLTAAGCQDNDLKDLPFVKFDLDRLKKQFVLLASQDFRTERIRTMGTVTASAIINTGFRRCYLLSKTVYKALAAGFSIVPFLDELVGYAARQDLRQTIGVQDKLTIKHKVSGTKDPLEEYLVEKNFEVPKEVLKSGYFQYLLPKKSRNTTTSSEGHSSQYACPQRQNYVHKITNKKHKLLNSTITARLVQLGIGAGVTANVLDDILRVLGSSASFTLRTGSTSTLVAGAVLTPVLAAWAWYNTGKRMNEHLHRLCDDLVIIFAFFIYHICQKGYERGCSSQISSANEQ